MGAPFSVLKGINISHDFGPDVQVIKSISFAADSEIIGLIGSNGAGKSTLLKIIAGEIRPTIGKIVTNSRPYYMAQAVAPNDARTVAQFLEVEDYLLAYNRILKGDVLSDDLTLLEGRWDLIDRLDKIRSIWFPSIPLDRPISNISGGEYASLAFAYLELHQPKIVLLDEPSNNLDISRRQLLINFLTNYKHTVIIATHDRRLLRYVDVIWELREGQLTVVRGTYDDYLAMNESRRIQREQRISNAAKEVSRINREVRALERRQASRSKKDRSAASNKRSSKMSMNGLKSRSEASSGRERARLLNRKQRAETERTIALSKMIELPQIRLQGLLDSPDLQSDKILRLSDIKGWNTYIGGQDRVSLLGDNGIGKSTLVRSITDKNLCLHVRAWAEIVGTNSPRVAVLTQNSSHLNDDNSIREELISSLGQYGDQEIFSILARLSFSASRSNELVRDLSGGERFRIALSKVLLSKHSKQLIVLDEPTNNLDLESLRAVEEMLTQFSGAILVISHDIEFLYNISVNRWIELTSHGLFELTSLPKDFGCPSDSPGLGV